MYKKYGNVSQKFGDSTSYKKVINKHPNLYTNNSLTKQTNNPLISNKYSNRSNSANKKRPTHLVNLSHPISKNFKVDTQITKLNPKLNSTRLTVHKKSFSCGKRFSSINNSFYNKHSLNDSWVFNKNINKSNSEKKERAKTPNMTKINSSKLNVSKLNLNAFSMGGSPNIKVSNNCNPKNKNNVSHINNLNGHKVHSKGGGFVKKNIFSRFKKKFSMDPSSKQKTSVVVNEDNYKMINKMNNNNKNNQNAHNHSSTTQPTEKEAAISNDSGNGNKKTNNLMHIFSGVENVINKETNRMSKNINHNNYMDVTSENFELKNNKVQISTNGHFIKKIKCIHDLSKTGLSGDEKKVNQDNYFIFKNFNNTFTDIFMGVCDGHGYYGHEVSGYIRENLPMNLNHLIKAYKINLVDENDKQRLFDAITKAFVSENNNLLNNKMIDSTLSGSTCVSLIYTPEKLIIANIGDSRCILGEELENGQWKTHELSRDHKPTIPEEAERIRKKGGRIRQMKDDDGTFIGPLRVYMKEKDIPGLAMTRSFGDYYASTAGTIPNPEISEYYFSQGDRFLILASDGLYEFISSEDVVNYVKEFYTKDDIVGCCEYLYKESCRRWLKEEEDTIDDITIIVVFFEE